MNNLGQQQKVNIDISKTKPVKCECGCQFYYEVIIMREVSGLLIGQTQNQISQVKIFICLDCKTPHPSFRALLQEPQPEQKESIIKSIH